MALHGGAGLCARRRARRAAGSIPVRAMGQAPVEVQALLRKQTTSHQVHELHYLKKLPGRSTGASGTCGSPLIVFLNGAGERGPADGSELDRACMHGVLKVALAGPKDSPGLPGTILDGFLILNPQL